MYIPGIRHGELPVFEPALPDPFFEWSKDSLSVWYNRESSYSGRAILGPDTTRIREAEGKFNRKKVTILPITGRLHPREAAKFKIDAPIARIDTSKIELRKDTLRNIPFAITRDSLSNRIIEIKANWIPTSRYVARFEKGAISDSWGFTNDTFSFSFVINGLDQYSNLVLKAHGMDSSRQYLIQIKSGEQIQKSFVVNNMKEATLAVPGMVAGKYTIEMIEDLNENGIWDTGDFDLHRQPEKRKIFTPDNLRAAWDVEIDLQWE